MAGIHYPDSAVGWKHRARCSSGLGLIVSGPNVAPEIYFLIDINPLGKSTPKSPIEESTPRWNSQPCSCSTMGPKVRNTDLCSPQMNTCSVR